MTQRIIPALEGTVPDPDACLFCDRTVFPVRQMTFDDGTPWRICTECVQIYFCLTTAQVEQLRGELYDKATLLHRGPQGTA